MPAPYSPDLRHRVVEAYERGEGTYAEIALRFRVGEASVNRWVNKVRRTGSLAPEPMGGSRRPKLITPEIEGWLVEQLEQDCSWTTVALVGEVQRVFDVSVCRQTIGKALRDAGFTRKRGSFVRRLPSRNG